VPRVEERLLCSFRKAQTVLIGIEVKAKDGCPKCEAAFCYTRSFEGNERTLADINHADSNAQRICKIGMTALWGPMSLRVGSHCKKPHSVNGNNRPKWNEVHPDRSGQMTLTCRKIDSPRSGEGFGELQN